MTPEGAHLAREIMRLPPAEQARALRLVAQIREQAAPDPRERAAKYAEDPEGYAREILGSDRWTRQHRIAAQKVLDGLNSAEPRKIMLAGGHGTGKTFGIAEIISWIFDARGSRPAPGGGYQGCLVVLTAPGIGAVKGTVYEALLRCGRAAAALGHKMPGWDPRHSKTENYRGASAASISWREGPWSMEAITPPRSAGGGQAHSAGGRHHPYNQVLAVEEALGLHAGIVKALTGLGAARNVVTLAATNPTERSGPLYSDLRQNPETWGTVAFSQIEHPNVLSRREVIPGCVDHLDLEAALRSPSFQIMGPVETTPLDSAHLDFLYALPERGVDDALGPRSDGVPGHPAAPVVVIRPATALAAGQRLGTYLEADVDTLLFQLVKIETLMLSCPPLPDRSPDQVGVDCAEARPPVACPRWGPPARRALDGDVAPDSILCGIPHHVPWVGTDGTAKAGHSADALILRYGMNPRYALDRAFGGPVGDALASRGANVNFINFGDSPEHEPLELYGAVANRRAEMAIECATALHTGIMRIPYSEALIRQMRATGSLLVMESRREVKILRKKKDIEAEIGKSPDELDALWLALAATEPIRRATKKRLRSL